MPQQPQPAPAGSPSPPLFIPRHPRRHRHPVLRVIVWVAVCIYLAVLLSAWVYLRRYGDRRWLATVLIFGPRWAWASPMVVLVPAAVVLARRALVVLFAALLIVLWPIMGLNVPLSRLGNKTPQFSVRVLTCNVHGHALDIKAMLRLIDETEPDVVALQECSSKTPDLLFPSGWHKISDNNHLVIASRYPIAACPEDVRRHPWGLAQLLRIPSPVWIACYRIETPGRPIYFVNLHLFSPHNAFDAILRHRSEGPGQVEENARVRLQQSLMVRDYVDQLDGPCLLAGDFNTPPDSTIYRAAWRKFCNAFASAGWGFGYTYWHGKRAQVRIDHILGTSGWQCAKCWVGPYVGSLHRPLIADMQWAPGEGVVKP